MISLMEPTSASADQLMGRELPRAVFTSFASLIISSRPSEMLVSVPSEIDSLAYKGELQRKHMVHYLHPDN